MVHHYRKLAVICAILIAILLFCVPSPAHAVDPVVHITVSAWVFGAPNGFTLTYVNDHRVDISWVKATGAEYTMVRAKYGSSPSDRSDGYLVYYDTGESVTDNSPSLDNTADLLYYRAWSQKLDGTWDSAGVSKNIGGIGMTLIALVILVLGLLISSVSFKVKALMWMAGVSSVGLAIYGLNNIQTSMDVNEIIGLIGIGLSVIIFLMAGLSLRGDKEETQLTEDEAYSEELRASRERHFATRKKYGRR
jgi:hypothetical protein